MRMGPHVMLPLVPGTTAHSIYVDWVTRVQPPFVKFCRQGFDPSLMAWTRSKGAKVGGRWVEGEISNPGGVLNELLQFANHLDYVEFANEESQGKDDPREWDRLMGKCLDFMMELDKRNRAAGRFGPKAIIANTSVGQPELERWSRPSTLECARYAEANGHRWGLHSYYKPDPWSLLIGDKAAWDGPAPAAGWLMLRETQAVRIMHENGIAGFRFIITESGRDNIPGQPGPGGGFRDVPGEPFAERMAQYGRHLSALPCDGWCDYGFNAWDGWKQFDLTEDPAMAERVILAQLPLPRGGEPLPAPAPAPTPSPAPTPPGGGTMPNIVTRPSQHWSSRSGQRVKYIIVHSTYSPQGSTPEGTAGYLVKNDRGVSVHEYIPTATTAYVMVDDSKAAHHAESQPDAQGRPTVVFPDGTPWNLANEVTWGIELYQQMQEAVSAGIVSLAADRVADACRRFRLPVTSVLMHREISPGRRTDPVGVSSDAFRALVAQRLGAAAPQFGKVVWALENSQRILEGEGLMAESRWMGEHYTDDAKRRRDGTS